VSYIESELFGKVKNHQIIEFLKKEGFKEGTGPHGSGTMFYVASGSRAYAVWFTLIGNSIDLYAEYDCGGHVGDTTYHFDEDDFQDFMRAYKDSVAWAKSYI
jgi:hypothetical protein